MSKYAKVKKPIDYLISEEVAIEQVQELLEYYDIDVEALSAGESKEEKDRAVAFERTLDHVSRAFRTGTLALERDKDGRLEVHHTIRGAEPLIYIEIGARHKVAMERFSAEAGYSRVYAFMGSLSGIGKAGIEKLGPVDLGIVEVLGTLFLNA